MVYLEGNCRVRFSDTTFRGSGHYGLWVPSGCDIGGFERNVFAQNARAMIVHPDRAGAIEATNTINGNIEDRVRVTYGNTDTVMNAATWKSFGAPFYVTNRTFVRAGLTIAAGVVVEFAQDASLIVDMGGTLTVAGTSDAKVTLRGGEDLVGYWKGVQIDTVSAMNTITQAVIADAGSAQWHGGAYSTAALHVTGDGSVALSTVTFAKSGGYAMVVESSGSASCSSVDGGAFQFYFADGDGAQATCP
jgi:hypothetical protein